METVSPFIEELSCWPPEGYKFITKMNNGVCIITKDGECDKEYMAKGVFIGYSCYLNDFKQMVEEHKRLEEKGIALPLLKAFYFSREVNSVKVYHGVLIMEKYNYILKDLNSLTEKQYKELSDMVKIVHYRCPVFSDLNVNSVVFFEKTGSPMIAPFNSYLTYKISSHIYLHLILFIFLNNNDSYRHGTRTFVKCMDIEDIEDVVSLIGPHNLASPAHEKLKLILLKELSLREHRKEILERMSGQIKS